MIKTHGGLEFWSDEGGTPFVMRIANLEQLVCRLENHGVQIISKSASEFWDINRFPAGILRAVSIRFNQLWFLLRLPTFLSHGIAIIGEKRAH